MSAPPAGLPRLARVARALLLLGLAGALIVPWLLVSARGLLHPPGEAQAVAREFFEAWRDGDQAALARLCGPTAEVDMAGSGLGPLLGALRFEMEEAPRLMGSRARVPFVLTAGDGPGVPRAALAAAQKLSGERGEVVLAQEMGSWRVTSLVVRPRGGGTAATLPRTNWFPELKVMTPEQFDRAWRLSRRWEGGTAREIFEEVVRDGGLVATGESLSAVFTERRVGPLAFDGLSRVEILDRVLALEGLTASYSLARVSLFRGRAPRAVYTGPFRVTASISTRELVGPGRGEAQLSAVALDLPMSAWFGMWADSRPPALTARAAGGASLLHDLRVGRGTVSSPLLIAGGKDRSGTWSVNVPLRFLTADIDRVGVLEGKVRVPLPARIQPARLDLARRSGEAKFDGGSAAVRWLGDGAVGRPNAKLELTVRAPAGHTLFGRWVNGDGEELRLLWWWGHYTEELVPPVDAVALELKLATMKDVELPFVFRDLRVPNRPPQRIEPLRFGGNDRPVSASVGLGPKGEWRVRLKNHSNKVVEEVRLVLRGLDQGGREVERRSWAWSISQDRSLRKVYLELEESEDLAHDGPVGEAVTWPATVASVTAVPEVVFFTDGVVWRASDRGGRRESKAPSKAPE